MSNAQPDDLTPPDDFGASVIAEFERRANGTGSAAMLDAAGEADPPGGWPGGSNVDSSRRFVADEVAGTTEEPTNTVDDDSSRDAGQADPPSAVPDGGSAPAPEATPPEEPEPETEQQPPPAASGYAWTYTDTATGTEQRASFTDEQVQRALSLAAWADNLPDQTRAALGAIEDGQAVAIPRTDFDQFVAWRNQQQKSSRDADLEQLDIDPDVAKLIGSLRDEVSQLRGGGVPTNAPPAQYANLNANLDSTAAQFDVAVNAYGQRRALSEPELQALVASAVQANIIPSLMESNSTFNPVTGALLRPADIGTVTDQALDYALIRNPALHTAVVSRQAPSNPVPTASDAAVTAKRARAASLASAPSAAVAPSPRSRQVSDAERLAAMEAELAAAMGRA